MRSNKFDLFINESQCAYSIYRIIYKDGQPQDFEFISVNDVFERMTGLSAGELLTKKVSEMLPLYIFNNQNIIFEAFNKAIKTKNNVNIDVHIAKSAEWYRVSVFSLDDNCLMTSIVNITREYQQEQDIAELENLNMDLFCLIDRNGNVRKVNKKSYEILGYKAEELEGKNIFDYLHPDDIEETLNAYLGLYKKHSTVSLINRFRDKNKKYRYIEWYTQSKVGEFACFSARDITDKKILEQELRNQATRDELTGLYNRHYFDEIIGIEIESANKQNEPLSISLLDLDCFKAVNDTWGHPMGDEILIQVAKTMEEIIRDSDVLVRFGGEEFLILMKHTNIQGAVVASEKIRKELEKKQHPVIGTQTASFGVATRMKSESFRSWYRRADKALYKAKHLGRNCVVASDDNIDLSVALENLSWKEQWNSGNDKIDQQHRELMERAKELITIFMEVPDASPLRKGIPQLIKDINNHFLVEESVLSDLQFPEYKEHTEAHKKLNAKMLNYMKEYKNGDVRLVDLFVFLTDDVLIGHLQEMDSKFFSYLKQKN